MDPMKVIKALCNVNRLRILQWLDDPSENFTQQDQEDIEEVGVCVDFIREKAGISQSTTSQYMSKLQEADLVTSTRIGQWTYYQRNEETIQEFADFVSNEL